MELGTVPTRDSALRFARSLIWPTPADIRRDWGVMESAVFFAITTAVLGIFAIDLLRQGDWYCLFCATGAIWFGRRTYACALARKW